MYVRATYACRRRMCAYARETGPTLSSNTIFHIEPIYTHISHMKYALKSLNNNVILKSRLYPHISVCICVKIIKMQEKKLDISPFLYIVLIITVFALAV